MSTKKLAGWIGSTSYAAKEGRGDHPGTVCLKFPTVNAFNEYFEEHDSLLVVDVQYHPRWWGLFTTVLAMTTNQISPEELADMNEVSREVEFAMAGRRRDRAIMREKDEAENKLSAQEKERLAEVGKKYEARVKHMRKMDPGSKERKDTEALLNAGDPEVLNAILKDAEK